MRPLVRLLREHRHFLVVITMLILVMTWPTVVYVLRSDVFWLPTGSSTDVFIKIWDVWYGKLFLTGQADRIQTNLIFFPEGVSLTHHPFFIPHIIFFNLLRLILPLPNAFSLTFLLMIFVCSLSAYVFINYLFREKWLPLFGAVVFGLSPHVLVHPNHPEIAFVATLPAMVYCLHRGIRERRTILVVLAGLFAGLTTVVSLYTYVCLLITVGLLICALTPNRWRNWGYWRLVLVFALVTAVASSWRIIPLLTDAQAVSELAAWHGADEGGRDAVSFFVNHEHPILGPLGQSIFSIPDGARISESSYLGYLVMLLCAIALISADARRRAFPWALLAALLLMLRLGSVLSINGRLYENFPLPKEFLDRLLPFVFESFHSADHFMMGAILPLAVLSTYGLSVLRKRMPLARQSWFVLLLIALVAFEYYVPVKDGMIPQERFAFIDWLATEDDQDIALINLPMGRKHAKVYNLYQALSGYPHAEGAISRTPDRAFEYIRANRLLNGWLQNKPVNCETESSDSPRVAAA